MRTVLEEKAHLITSESKSSSTPALGFPAKTGATETVMSAVTSWNSRSRPLPLPSFCVGWTSDFLSFFCGWLLFVAPAFRFDGGLGEDGDIVWRGARRVKFSKVQAPVSRVTCIDEASAGRGTFELSSSSHPPFYHGTCRRDTKSNTESNGT